MHKTVCIALMLVLVLVTATACGSTSAPTSAPTPLPPKAVDTPVPTSKPAATPVPAATAQAPTAPAAEPPTATPAPPPTTAPTQPSQPMRTRQPDAGNLLVPRYDMGSPVLQDLWVDAANGVHSSSPLFFFMQRYIEAYIAEMCAFVECIQQGAPPPVGGADARAAVQMAHAAARSLAENRPVRVDEVAG